MAEGLVLLGWAVIDDERGVTIALFDDRSDAQNFVDLDISERVLRVGALKIDG